MDEQNDHRRFNRPSSRLLRRSKGLKDSPRRNSPKHRSANKTRATLDSLRLARTVLAEVTTPGLVTALSAIRAPGTGQRGTCQRRPSQAPMAQMLIHLVGIAPVFRPAVIRRADTQCQPMNPSERSTQGAGVSG